jgi:hypothetical protein
LCPPDSNLLADAPWPVMIFATCDRIPDYRFG